MRRRTAFLEALEAGELIRAKKDRLYKQIENDARLKADFDFFLSKAQWPSERLLSHLFWDCNMIAASPQAVISNEKKEAWPISEEALRGIIKNLRKTADQVEKLNGTRFSPLKNIAFYDEYGKRLSLKNTIQLSERFAKLPEVLRAYTAELKRKVEINASYWRKHRPAMEAIVFASRGGSLYERIRAATGSYHQNRLRRLVNAAREDQGLAPIQERNFTVWLNRLKRRHSVKS